MIPSPFIPESAPFTLEQRAWLNGYIAAMFSMAMGSGVRPAAPPPVARPRLSIFFGSQTGNAESLARKAGASAKAKGFDATVADLCDCDPERFRDGGDAIFLVSTFGDGEPPDGAKPFWAKLSANADLDLRRLRYAVLALGDSNYAKFCAFGRALDEKLAALGATRVADRVECDVDFDESYERWLGAVIPSLAPPAAAETHALPSRFEIGDSANGTANGTVNGTRDPKSLPGGSPKNPFASRLLANVRLNSPESDKDTRLAVFSLDGCEVGYEAGDALGVVPKNDPALVEAILARLGWSGDEPAPPSAGYDGTTRDALLHARELTRMSRETVKTLAAKTGDPELRELLDPACASRLSEWLWGRDVLDALTEFRNVRFEPEEFFAVLKKLAPRLYSISSSPKARAGEVHLTVGVVSWTRNGRARGGACSNFIARSDSGDAAADVFVHRNPSFRLPEDPDAPVIMVGPGTGIAPFRAFLQEREATGAKGKAWLFFGDRRSGADFLYREELEGWLANGTLSRLDTAFSRDGGSKVYVQDRMREAARELHSWLEEGATFYVCGDAKRMAADVDEALADVVATASGRSREAAETYVAELRSAKRIRRDVY